MTCLNCTPVMRPKGLMQAAAPSMAPHVTLLQEGLERLALPLVRLGLTPLYLDCALQVLSDGYKRRVALAVQLVRRPKVRGGESLLCEGRLASFLVALPVQLAWSCRAPQGETRHDRRCRRGWRCGQASRHLCRLAQSFE